MASRLRVLLIVLAASSTAWVPHAADAQIGGRLRRAAERAAERETIRQVDRQVTNVVRCVLTDQACIDGARSEGKTVEVVDADGNVVETADGTAAPQRPGEGAWANYDFVPGEEVLAFEDYTGDEIGDFPRRFALVTGSWEIVEWQGSRYLRALSNGLLGVPLPKTLPERFTIEFDVSVEHGNSFVRAVTGRAYYGPDRRFRGTAPTYEIARAGVRAVGGAGPEVLTTMSLRGKLETFRVMADGNHMKVYVGERRVANVPNAVIPRSDTLFIAVGWAREQSPILIGPIRIAGGGRSLYDALAKDGRVATQGIFFATGSDRIRPESTPTLHEIRDMLATRGAMRLLIEGHTDDVGDDAANQRLSERRAAAVREYLIGEGIEDGRLQARGFGESRPAAPNTTAEGRQQNRRVELVRID